jgi:cyclic pyranopterin phosphate synthase
MTPIALGLPAVRRNPDAALDDMPRQGPLVDTFGRVASDLRVSLTDRCNLRCTYCMPAEGLDWLPGQDLLTPDELTRLLRLAVTRLGITSIRFTGGEPLLYRGLEHIITATARLAPRPEIALTTNGVGLAARARGLAAAGLDRVNVSLDTLDPGHFAAITRRAEAHYLVHVESGAAGSFPLVNGNPIGAQAQRLRDNDVITLAGVKMAFFEG